MPDVPILITLPFPQPLIERLQAVSPRLRLFVHPARRAEDLPLDLLPDIEVLYTHRALPDPEVGSQPALDSVPFCRDRPC